MSPWVVAALSGAGLAGAASVHCLTMCGPLAAACQARGGKEASLHYFLGRFVSYVLLGCLAGSVGQGLLATRWSRWLEALLAWTLAAVLLHAALSSFGLFQAPKLLRLGLGPRSNWVGRMLSRVAHDPLLLGAATALLPCSALLGALLASAALGSGAEGALSMACFALLTTPALLGAAQLGRVARLGTTGKRAFGGVLIAGALITALRPLPALRAEAEPSCPLHPSPPTEAP